MLKTDLIHATKTIAKRLPFADLARKVFAPIPLAPAIAIARRRGWDGAASWLLSGGGKRLLGDARLHGSLTRDIVLDAELELLLTAVRKALVCGYLDALDDDAVLAFAVALIEQCLLNEFVFFISQQEAQWLADARAYGARPPVGNGYSWKYVAARGLYEPFEAFVDETWERDFPTGTVPSMLRERIAARLTECRQEAEIRSGIESFGSFEDATSRHVAAMYEESPYPRWIHKLHVPSGSRRDYLRGHFSDTELGMLNAGPDVLVAGCATGSQVIQCALGYGPSTRVLAVDLSRSSIAYAVRKAREHGVNNVEYMQGDILELTSLARSFDVVESVGVIHHMANPFQGWGILTGLLRPGGIMHIGLHSTLARRQMSRYRDGIDLTLLDRDKVRSRRGDIMAQQDPARIWKSGDVYPFCRDFFSLSNCRDLLFPVQVSTYTIPELRESLDRLGLEFRGFVKPPALQSKAFYRFPKPRDLDGWWAFEQRNPDTFVSMYDFWCLKPT